MIDLPPDDPDEQNRTGPVIEPLGDVTPVFEVGAAVGDAVGSVAGAIGEGLAGAAGEVAGGCGGCSLVLLAGLLLMVSGGVAFACS